MKLRPARPDEFGELTLIWRAAVDATHDFVSASELDGYEARMPTEFLPAVELTVAANDADKPLGFIGVSGSNIEMLFVDPASHGRGIGRRLVEHASAGGGDLTVDVNEENEGAVGFYRLLGFEQTGRSDLDQDGNRHPLVHFRLIP